MLFYLPWRVHTCFSSPGKHFDILRFIGLFITLERRCPSTIGWRMRNVRGYLWVRGGVGDDRGGCVLMP